MLGEDFYQTNNEYLSERMFLFDKILKLNMEQFRNKQGRMRPAFESFYISDQEIDNSLLSGKPGKCSDSEGVCGAAELKREIILLECRITEKLEKTRMHGIQLPVIRLIDSLLLTPFELKIVELCLLPELDRKYARIFAYLQDDMNLRFPAIGFCIQLLLDKFEERMAARSAFSSTATLFHYRILVFVPGDEYAPGGLMSRQVYLNSNVASFLMDQYSLGPGLADVARIYPVPAKDARIDVPGELKQKLSHVTITHHPVQSLHRRGYIFALHGVDEKAKTNLAFSLVQDWGLPLLKVDFRLLLAQPEKTSCLIRDLIREVLLFSCAVFFYNADIVRDSGSTENPLLSLFFSHFNQYALFAFFSSDQPLFLQKWIEEQILIELEFPYPDYRTRVRYWSDLIRFRGYVTETQDIPVLAARFQLTRQEIEQAGKAAFSKAFLENPGEAVLSSDHVFAACRNQSNRMLKKLASKIKPRYSFEDIVLPSRQLCRLKDIVNFVKYRDLVFSEWGFADKFALGMGLNILFHGYSGTGKTMAADIIGSELGLELYKLDLSRIVSKYIGETEKNLNTIFSEAENSNSILFFDEADALFGKRSEVRDAHDRYANIEVGYLLQKMEEYTGIVILATNLRQNMDDAFVRRMHFSLEFPFPDEKQRFKIWKNIFPESASLEESIDFGFLAGNLKITGGNIKNIALSAAFLAAGDGRKINMENIIHASKMEFDKMGKLCVKADFGEYYSMLAERPV